MRSSWRRVCGTASNLVQHVLPPNVPVRQWVLTAPHVAARVQARMVRWLRRRGLIDERPAEDRPHASHEPSPLEACMQIPLQRIFLRLASDGTPLPLDEPFRRPGLIDHGLKRLFRNR